MGKAKARLRLFECSRGQRRPANTSVHEPEIFVRFKSNNLKTLCGFLRLRARRWNTRARARARVRVRVRTSLNSRTTLHQHKGKGKGITVGALKRTTTASQYLR